MVIKFFKSKELLESKKGDKDQDTTWESEKNTIKHHKREPMRSVLFQQVTTRRQ